MVESESRGERAARYRKMAEEAEGFAKDSPFPERREKYLELAREWHLLAEALERDF